MIWLQVETVLIPDVKHINIQKMRCVVNKIPNLEHKPNFVSFCVFL